VTAALEGSIERLKQDGPKKHGSAAQRRFPVDSSDDDSESE
jgi:hypothetical protein